MSKNRVVLNMPFSNKYRLKRRDDLVHVGFNLLASIFEMILKTIL